jgi:hypothetical protein
MGQYQVLFLFPAITWWGRVAFMRKSFQSSVWPWKKGTSWESTALEGVSLALMTDRDISYLPAHVMFGKLEWWSPLSLLTLFLLEILNFKFSAFRWLPRAWSCMWEEREFLPWGGSHGGTCYVLWMLVHWAPKVSQGHNQYKRTWRKGMSWLLKDKLELRKEKEARQTRWLKPVILAI